MAAFEGDLSEAAAIEWQNVMMNPQHRLSVTLQPKARAQRGPPTLQDCRAHDVYDAYDHAEAVERPTGTCRTVKRQPTAQKISKECPLQGDARTARQLLAIPRTGNCRQRQPKVAIFSLSFLLEVSRLEACAS